jgi:hypothetical protein
MTETNVSGDVVNIQIPTNSSQPKYPWVSPVITTVIGIVVAIGLTWYQINRSEQEEQKAQVERIKAVKSRMVSIVEDHVINNQSIDISRLSRLIDIKSREANIGSPPRLLEIIQLAELNIINSGYLDFKTKESYKKVFDNIFSNLGKEYKVDYVDTKNSALIEQLITSIKVGNPEDAISNLQLLLEAHSSELKVLEPQVKNKSDGDRLFTFINEEPMVIIIFIILYAFALWKATPLMRRVLSRNRNSSRRTTPNRVAGGI